MITLYIGCMFAGKTTALLRQYQKAIYAQKKVILIKHSNDTRFDPNYVQTHNGEGFVHNNIQCRTLLCDKLMDTLQIVKLYDVILIDEGQFFNDIVEFTDKLVDNKQIIISALDGDHKRNPFGEIYKLIPRAENVIKLHAICIKCGENASFTKRISIDDKIIVIGGSDKYEAVCRKHYL